MAYLERNAEIIAEINNNIRNGIPISKGVEVGRSEKGTVFTSAGSYKSDVLGAELFYGIKQYKRGYLDAKMPRDLALIRSVVSQLPYLEPEFPVFMGILSSSQGDSLGVLLEDFSQGGKLSVTELHPDFDADKLPIELRNAIGDPNLDVYELAKVCFLVGDNMTRRLGDFDSLLAGVPFQERLKRFPIGDLMDLTPYTVIISK